MGRHHKYVRMSVRTMSESKDPDWHVNKQDHTHQRYQKFTLVPLSMSQIYRAEARGEYEADWVATPSGYAKPKVEEGDLLVKVDGDNNPITYFEVVAEMPRGRKHQYALKERPALQS